MLPARNLQSGPAIQLSVTEILVRSIKKLEEGIRWFPEYGPSLAGVKPRRLKQRSNTSLQRNVRNRALHATFLLLSLH